MSGGSFNSSTAGDTRWSSADDGDNSSSKVWSAGANWSTGGGGGGNTTPSAGGDWRNDSAGSVELSPGSQWKKEVVSVGNWADTVPSPRSDQEDNPLNASLETVTRKIVW